MPRRRDAFDVPGFLEQSMSEIKRERAVNVAVANAIQEDFESASQFNDPNGWSLDEIQDLRKASNTLYKRSCRTLSMYRPLPAAEGFHKSMAGEIGIVGSNRAGKSVAAAVEISWAATGTHPIADKYPREGLDICMLGPRLEHLRLLYRMYFGQGRTFKIIKNGIDWEPVNWNIPDHMARMSEWKDAPPLITPDLVDGEVDWYEKKAMIPRMIKLINGTTFYFFSMEQDPPRGVPFHIAGIDEEAPGVASWISELRMRFVSVMGRLIWSSTPESATTAFWNLKIRSERPDMKDKVPYKQTQFFEMLNKDNIYLPPLGLEAAKERLEEDDPEAAAAKIDGEWAARKFMVYPEFNENIHIIDSFDIEWRDTVYIVIDPGRTRNGTLFAAILHPDSEHYQKEQPDRIVIFDEMLLETARDKKGNYIGINAQSYARKLRDKFAPYKHWIEDITFDFKQGQKKDDYDVSIMSHYQREMNDVGISPRNRNFIAGYSNIDYGVEEVSKHLIQPEGLPPKVVIMKGKCPNLIYGLKRYQREQLRGKDGKIIPGKPIAKRNEMVDCLRYACCRNFSWVSPPSATQNRMLLTGQELSRLANDNSHWTEFMFRDYYSQFDRKPRNRN